jgi:hypothetical protein
MIKHDNYNCKITTADGQEHLVYANWIHNEGFDNWKGYRCDAGYTNFHIDKNFNVWSGTCHNNLLGNILTEWSIKTDTICERETCIGCTDDLITKKYQNDI